MPRTAHRRPPRPARRPCAPRAAPWLAVLAAALLAFAAPERLDAAELTRFRSRHYTIHTDIADLDTLRVYGRHMDAVFDAYRRRFRDYEPRHGLHMPLYLFRTREGYQAFLDRHGIDANNSGGMFFVSPEARGLATWTRGRGREDVFEVLQHEGFHQFAWNYLGAELPQWVNEGLAQYFEDGVFTDGKLTTGLADARRIRIVKRALAEGRALDVEAVLDLDAQAWNRTLAIDAAAAELLYAQSWSMVYFLIHGDDHRYQKHFAAYLTLLSRGRPSAAAFRRAFGIETLAPMRERWSAFARTHTADPLSLATERMTFLAAGMRWLHDHSRTPPKSLDELRRTLRAASFRLIRRTHEGSYVVKAEDPTLYGFEVRGVFKPFDLLAPAADKLPPRIVAQGLDPEPLVQWELTRDGELVHSIEYR